jgi:predicted membrane channel-forming protein YqfA (hemolysin III family)
MKHFRTPTYRWMRTSLFLAMGLSGIVPICHGIINFGFAMAFQSISLGHMIAMGAFYVVGALLYGHRYAVENHSSLAIPNYCGYLLCFKLLLEFLKNGILESLISG